MKEKGETKQWRNIILSEINIDLVLCLQQWVNAVMEVHTGRVTGNNNGNC